MPYVFLSSALAVTISSGIFAVYETQATPLVNVRRKLFTWSWCGFASLGSKMKKKSRT